MLQGKKICLIGAGNIAEALVSGLLKGQVVQPSQIFATDVLSEQPTAPKEEFPTWGKAFLL